jgi:hypothetical protein
MPGDSNTMNWTGIGLGAFDEAQTVKAAGFTTGSTSYALDSVALTLGSPDHTLVSGVSLTLRDDAGGTPGSILLSFDNPASFTDGIADYVFLP